MGERFEDRAERKETRMSVSPTGDAYRQYQMVISDLEESHERDKEKLKEAQEKEIDKLHRAFTEESRP